MVRVRYRHWVFRLPFLRHYRGLCLGRTILFKEHETDVSAALLRHELIHQEQIDRHGITRFYAIYFRDYLANLWRLRDNRLAYRTIPFEQEAYARERENGPLPPFERHG